MRHDAPLRGAVHSAKRSAAARANPKRSRRDSGVVARFKAGRLASGTAQCDVCQWTPPTALLWIHEELTRGELFGMLHAHHVVPVACRGVDAPENLALLCPTHHAVAHRLGRMVLPSKRHRYRTWEGPRDPEALVYEIRLVEEGGAEWSAHMRRGRDAVELVAAERRKAIRVANGGAA